VRAVHVLLITNDSDTTDMTSFQHGDCTFDPLAFRGALSQFPTGVCVVTAVDALGQAVGLTINSFSSVSLDPPLVLWSLLRSSPSLATFRSAGRFAISVLAEDQTEISTRFAAAMGNRFDGVRSTPDAGGVPLIERAAAHFSCESWNEYDGGDHVIIVGKVVRFAMSSRAPLVFSAGRYGVVKGRKKAPSLEDLWPIPFW
jgi:flavin reductase (DIM6/NTAB) family NADH-FMN oxidoreductase RutF